MFQVRAWEEAYGLTYAEAVGAQPQNGRQALIGKSEILRAQTELYFNPSGTQLPTPLVSYGLESFTVQVVPEPEALLIVTLGLL